MIPAFTDDELEIVRLMRSHEIRVTHDGRLEVWFPVSDEACAKELHKLSYPSQPYSAWSKYRPEDAT